MQYHLLQEFRERLIERYDPLSLIEILEITSEDIWDQFMDRILQDPEIAEDLGMNELTEESEVE